MSETREILNEVRDRQLASLLVSGLSVSAAAKEIKLSAAQAHRIMETEEFRAALREISDKLLANSANTWKAAISQLVTKSIEVLKNKLDQNDLEAVKLVVRSLGVEKQAEAPMQGNISIILPDYSQPKHVDIDVSNE